MPKAVTKPITTKTDLGELIPAAYEITEDHVLVSLRDKAGALVIFTMDFCAMIESITMATKLLNSNIGNFVDAAAAVSA